MIYENPRAGVCVKMATTVSRLSRSGCRGVSAIYWTSPANVSLLYESASPSHNFCFVCARYPIRTALMHNIATILYLVNICSAARNRSSRRQKNEQRLTCTHEWINLWGEIGADHDDDHQMVVARE